MGKQISTDILKPQADGTAALKITKADGVTPIVTIDSTNETVALPDGRLYGATEYQGRRISILNPYQARANRYKVQLHAHSTGSDGADTPAALATAYEAAGYDALAITDHNVLTADPEVAGVLHIPGVEETEWSGHKLNLFAIGNKSETTAQGIIDAILLDDALCGVAHPWWWNLPTSANTVGSWIGFQLIEIASAVLGRVGSSQVDETTWDYLLTRHRNVWALANDDCHNIAWATEFNVFFNEIMGDELSLTELKKSLRRGNFYPRQTGAPQLTLTMSGTTITVASSASANFDWIGRNGVVLKTEDGVSSSEYTIQGWEEYVRVRAKDNATDTYYAWTQPVIVLTYPAGMVSHPINSDGIQYTPEVAPNVLINNFFGVNHRCAIEQFNSYDMISEAATGTGSVSKLYYDPCVVSAANGDTAVLYQNSAIFSGLGSASLFGEMIIGFTQLSVATVDCEAFVGLADSGTTIITSASVTAHVGILYVVNGASVGVYAVNGNGTARTSTLLWSTVSPTYYKYKITWDKTTLRFYVLDTIWKPVVQHTTNISTAAMAWKMCIKGNENGAVTFRSRGFGFAQWL